MRDLARSTFALYIGGMGARDRNFYNDLAIRCGYEKEAREIQDAYLAGRKDEAAALVPGGTGGEDLAHRPGRLRGRAPRGLPRGRRHDPQRHAARAHARRRIAKVRTSWGSARPAGRGRSAIVPLSSGWIARSCRLDRGRSRIDPFRSRSIAHSPAAVARSARFGLLRSGVYPRNPCRPPGKYLTMPEIHQARRSRVQQMAGELDADAVLITHRPNVRYLTGLASSNAALLLPADGAGRARHRLAVRPRGPA